MNQELWNKILAFDFDNPPSEYGFSTRLAYENFWTKEFTDQAILEYKKFMYLVAIQEYMLSPSEIIDKVWHQHLIFTQSYLSFCDLLGKQIQHIPSTHNKEDFEKFKQAKDRTIKLYENEFGKQPKNIWAYNGMFESLNLAKAKINLRTFLIFGILVILCLTVPAYFALKPIYIHIGSPYFILGLASLTLVTLLLLELYNKTKLKKIVSESDATSFIYNLQPFELVYLKTQELSNVIHGAVNELVYDQTIKVNSDDTIQLAKEGKTNDIQKLQVIAALCELGKKTHYPKLVRNLETKPIFGNITRSMDAFRKYFNKSKKFGYLFYTNFAVFSLLLLLSISRIVTGVLRDKPVIIIVIFTMLLVAIVVVFLQRLTKQISTTIIPNLYKNEILPSERMEDNLQWSYFLLGTAVLTSSFIPLVTNSFVNKKNNSSNNSSSDSCGSSCSSCGSSCSSCGSSCGGCGGD